MADLSTLLNAPQADAVTHIHGPLLVLAGAGSGKTRVITYRIANLIAQHCVPPYRILAVTFTNKAANEMRQRLEHLLGANVARDLWVGTFHATCARLLRRFHNSVGLTRDFTIYDEADQKAVVSRVVKALAIDDHRYPPKQLLSCIHQQKQDGHTPDDLATTNPFDQTLLRVFQGYERSLRDGSAVDFDDLILHIMRLAESPTDPAGAELRSRFDFLLVDEFQDVNAVQYRLIRALANTHRNLCVVGDDDQSIYRWRGADVRIIRGFRHDFSDAHVVKLEQNYRSTQNIVSAALSVIKPSREREPKELFTSNPPGTRIQVYAAQNEHDEAAIVVAQIRHALSAGLTARDIAVFYRIHAQSRVLEQAFRAENLPYQIVGGTRFFDRAEVKDLLAYLRVIANPRSDVDLLRIINVPARGIGKTTLDKINDYALTLRVSVFESISSHLPDINLSSTARNRLAHFVAILQSLMDEATRCTPRALAEHTLDVTGYALSLKHENNAEADARLQNLGELLSSLDEYEAEAFAAGEQPSLPGYLERTSLVSDLDQLSAEERIPMMTVHSAKGLEFSTVFLTGMEEDLFPYRSRDLVAEPGQLEEERRLAYVALTRARQQLFITHAATRMVFGTTRYERPSRFLADIPLDNVDIHPSTSPFATPLPLPTQPQFTSSARAPGERYVERDAESLGIGARVVHNRFGEGTIRAIDDGSSPPVVVVFFPGWGERRIVASFLQPA